MINMNQPIVNDDFIKVFRDVYPPGYCQHLIDEFERMKGKGVGSSRLQSEKVDKIYKDDYSIMMNLKNIYLEPFDGMDPYDVFFKGLQNCFTKYTKLYPNLNDSDIITNDMKMQKTHPGGGYHIWHSEQGNKNPGRVLVFILYLNTLEKDDGGETEFLYQRKRVQPVENTVVLWPAAFTHAHRGNTVLGDKDKYIITGWFSLE